MRAVFIGGAGRSGTTLLGDLVGAHPRHVCTPETSYKIQLAKLGWGGTEGNLEDGLAKVNAHPKFRDLNIELRSPENASLASLFAQLVPSYAAKIGKPDADVWIDHTPSNLAIGAVLLEQFPGAALIHIVRDGRAVAASMIGLDWGPNNVIVAAREWVRSIALGLALEAAYPHRVHRVSYEELVGSPGPVLERICRFAGIEYHESMTQGGGLIVPKRDARQHALVGKSIDPSRAEAWRFVLTPRQIEIFESEVSSLLPLLGYTPVYGEHARNLSLVESLGYEAYDLVRSLTVNRRRHRRRYRVK